MWRTWRGIRNLPLLLVKLYHDLCSPALADPCLLIEFQDLARRPQSMMIINLKITKVYVFQLWQLQVVLGAICWIWAEN